jgi:hypothetical protein
MNQDLKPKSDDEDDILDTTLEGGMMAIVGQAPNGEGFAFKMSKRQFEQAQDQADREAENE